VTTQGASDQSPQGALKQNVTLVTSDQTTRLFQGWAGFAVSQITCASRVLQGCLISLSHKLWITSFLVCHTTHFLYSVLYQLFRQFKRVTRAGTV